ncbi:MAG TPA: bifunctional glutamate N-acetyltransferase/amino-acid acetyltransferase ArgJ, partial [Polyangiaceae bacterium LLY-WYZ-14_1]|nr:bifunctional glutamate N-acetyltransferase/amino-acid acetyltransferase ArgJ [Polyangiaceae bacterium LLY-WYZ-14_1]
MARRRPPLPAVRGFRFAAVSAGLKGRRVPDLGLVVADRPVSMVASFTTNLVQAAPVLLARDRVSRGRPRAVLVNSGNANACTGPAGQAAAERTTAALAAALGLRPAQVVPASTGVTGVPFPEDRVVDAIPRLVARASPDGAWDFARSILTTDRGPKTSSRTFSLRPRRTATVLGIGKGAGMIHPRMATTLAFVVTDAPGRRSLLRRILARALDATFHASTVDGDTSTNDMVLLVASGAIGGPVLSPTDRAAARLEAAVTEVLGELAEQIVADGEGARHAVTIDVRGTVTDGDARRVAETVATSLLVKTALHGRDPNWGRIAAAAGRAGVPFDPSRLDVRIG